MKTKTIATATITVTTILLVTLLSIGWKRSPSQSTEPSQYPRPLTLADLDEHPDERANRENYWFSGNVDGNDGNRYAFRITTEIVGGQSGTSFWLHKFGESGIYSETFGGYTVVTRRSNHVLVERDGKWQLTLTPTVFQLQVVGEKVTFNLTLTTIGLPFFYAKGEKATIATDFWGWGYEALAVIEGKILVQDNYVTVEGKGVHEHFWGNIVWDYTTSENWLPIHFEETAIQLFRVGRLEGGAYEDGYIHLLPTEEYSSVNNVEVEDINDMGDIKITAATEDGWTLSLLGIQYALFNPGHSALSFSGTLEYGEQTLNLTNGDGWREHHTYGYGSVDLNDDGKVNIIDISQVAIAFGSEYGDPSYNIQADITRDGIINIIDISIVALEFGKTL